MVYTILLTIDAVLSVCALIGAIVWSSSYDLFTLHSSYGFYWFMSIANTIICLLTFVILLFPSFFKFYMDITSNSHTSKYVFLAYSAIGSFFWLASAAGVAKLSSDCISLKNHVFLHSSFNCTGEIVSSIFGFLLFVLHIIFLTINLINVISNFTPNPTNIESQSITMEHVPEQRSEPIHEQTTEQTTKQTPEQTTKQTPEQTTEQTTEQTPEPSSEPSSGPTIEYVNDTVYSTSITYDNVHDF